MLGQALPRFVGVPAFTKAEAPTAASGRLSRDTSGAQFLRIDVAVAAQIGWA